LPTYSNTVHTILYIKERITNCTHRYCLHNFVQRSVLLVTPNKQSIKINNTEQTAALCQQHVNSSYSDNDQICS